MSCLAIYQPQAIDYTDSPEILPFPGHRLRIHPAEEPAPLRRARLLHRNQCCPECRSIAVDPLELNDALLNAQQRPIPGTATVVAFHCNRCYHEWPAR